MRPQGQSPVPFSVSAVGIALSSTRLFVRIAISLFGLRDIDQACGCRLSKDQVVPLKSARFEALLHGRVAAAILDPPYTTMATKAGYKLLVDLAPLDVPYLRNVVAVSQKALREDSATIARFVEALSEGMRYYLKRTAKRASAFWLNICGSRRKQIARCSRKATKPTATCCSETLRRARRHEDPSRSDWRLQPQSAQFESRIAHRFVFCRAPRPAGILRQVDACAARHYRIG